MAEPTSKDPKGALYDTACKKVLSEKGIVAHILKVCAEEYKNMSIEDIIKCIQDKPEIDKVLIQDISLPTRISSELTGLLGMLNLVFKDNDLTAAEKREKLANEFHIEITPELEKGVADMCNLSADIERRGIEKGRVEGENRLARLISHLLSIGKSDEIKAATESEKLRNELYKKYGIA